MREWEWDSSNDIKGFCYLTVVDDEHTQEGIDLEKSHHGFIEIDTEQKKAYFYRSGGDPSMPADIWMGNYLTSHFLLVSDVKGGSIQTILLRHARATKMVNGGDDREAYALEFREFLLSSTTRGFPAGIKTCTIALVGQQDWMWGQPNPANLFALGTSREEKALTVKSWRGASVKIHVRRWVSSQAKTALDKTESSKFNTSSMIFSFDAPVSLRDTEEFVRGFAKMASLLVGKNCHIESVGLWVGNDRRDWTWHFPTVEDTYPQRSHFPWTIHREILWNALDKTNERAVEKLLNEVINDVSFPINEIVQNLFVSLDFKDTCSVLERLGLHAFGKVSKPLRRKGKLKHYLNAIADSTSDYLSLSRVEGKHLVQWTVDVRNNHEHQALKLEQSPQLLYTVASSWITVAVTHMLVRCGFSESLIVQAIRGYGWSPYLTLRDKSDGAEVAE